MVSLRATVRKNRLLCIAAAAAFCLAAASLARAIDLPEELGGMPKDVPKRPRAIAPYPGVYDVPPPRKEPTMSDAAKIKLERDLEALRTRQDRLKDSKVRERGDAATAKTSAARDKARAEAEKKPSAAGSK